MDETPPVDATSSLEQSADVDALTLDEDCSRAAVADESVLMVNGDVSLPPAEESDTHESVAAVADANETLPAPEPPNTEDAIDVKKVEEVQEVHKLMDETFATATDESLLMSNGTLPNGSTTPGDNNETKYDDFNQV